MQKNKKVESAGEPEKNITQDMSILQSVRRIIRAIDIHSKELVSQFNITAPQLLALGEIAQKKHTTITELTKSIYLDASTLVGIIDRLEGKGFVKRERDKNDRRQIHIHISEKGREFIDKSPNITQSAVVRAINKLSPQEQAALSASLEKVISLMESDRK